ncbi:hypothetical protein J1N35_000874 [Gossypium stocksii]|uniref:Uncharacterized protein n=1 Tax=Gossypium stocksii TaxID=47602 RepID=A0A9D4AKV9_9ROSI|nr:hypothetical protein J1N35_000874 [Gossypium stocksii]
MMEQIEDRILETHINNLSECSLEVIHGHLRDSGFLYTAHMPKRTKLDPPLISVLVRDGDQRRTRFISPAAIVQLHSRTSIYNLVCKLKGMSLRGQLLMSIGVQHASNYRGSARLNFSLQAIQCFLINTLQSYLTSALRSFSLSALWSYPYKLFVSFLLYFPDMLSVTWLIELLDIVLERELSV